MSAELHLINLLSEIEMFHAEKKNQKDLMRFVKSLKDKDKDYIGRRKYKGWSRYK